MLYRHRQFWKSLRYNKLFLPTIQKNVFFYTAHEQSQHEEQKNRNLYKTTSISIAILGIGFYYYMRKKDINLFPSVSAISLGSRRQHYNFIADVVEQSVNALVSIEIIDSRRYDFFTGQNITESNGSGFIISEDGLILTNAHVVLSRPSTKLKIRLHDGATYVGVVEDIDMKADLATVRINAGKKLPIMKLGTSEDARVGEWVIAMGSPLSLTNTITTGVISTVSRTSKDLKLFDKDMQYLQTDAIITFGNSGGPLVNLDGEVIGINAMKVSTGISFAIPVEYAKEFIRLNEQKRKGSPVSEAPKNPKKFIGITMLSLTPELIRQLRQKTNGFPLEIGSGVLVWKVMVGSPAFRLKDMLTLSTPILKSEKGIEATSIGYKIIGSLDCSCSIY
nr:serine protease HTRA2, mitochondrial isoform X2 [Halyomorpha halys]